MKMSATAIRDMCRQFGIFNAHGFAHQCGPVNNVYTFDTPAPPVIEGMPDPLPRITYRAQLNGRGYQPWAWQVVRDGKQTDPQGHWRDQRNKTFNGFRFPGNATNQKRLALAAAQTWAAVRYGYAGTWTKDPWGNYMPTPFYEARLAQLTALAAELEAK